MRLFLCAFILTAALGCSSESDPSSAAARTVKQAEDLVNRPTPLREEVDEVAAVRDQVLRNSPK